MLLFFFPFLLNPHPSSARHRQPFCPLPGRRSSRRPSWRGRGASRKSGEGMLRREGRTRSCFFSRERGIKRVVSLPFFSSSFDVGSLDERRRTSILPSGVLRHNQDANMSPLHHHHDGDPPAPNAYEQEREARIAANRARLVELGIVASTNASTLAASMIPLGVLDSAPSTWSRSLFGGEKAKRRPTVSLKVSR